MYFTLIVLSFLHVRQKFHYLPSNKYTTVIERSLISVLSQFLGPAASCATAGGTHRYSSLRAAPALPDPSLLLFRSTRARLCIYSVFSGLIHLSVSFRRGEHAAAAAGGLAVQQPGRQPARAAPRPLHPQGRQLPAPPARRPACRHLQRRERGRLR